MLGGAALVALAALGACRREAPPAAATPEDRSSGGAMWGASYFPNVALTSHRGEHLRFFDDVIKDKVVAINFIYTRCTDACPMETARMVEVQKLLGDRLGSDVFFYSISIDPDHDTPEVLRAYAETWKTGPGWTFLTGSDADVTLLRKKLGLYEPDLTKRNHNISLIIGNQKTGRWMRRSPGENPYVLANELGSWLHNWKRATPEDRDFAHAPEIRTISTGEELFRARCAACHTVGAGDRLAGRGSSPAASAAEWRRGSIDGAERGVGPDLFDVHKRRERAWLVRWMMQPDAMLAERDPIAVELAARYRNVPMPNLRLTTSDANLILAYLEEESRGVARRSAAVASGPLDDKALASAREVIDGYARVQAALAADDLEAARAGAVVVERSAPRAGTPPSLAVIGDAAHRIASASDLDTARRGFGELSQHVVGMLVGEPRLRTGQHLFACSMVEGYPKWIQPGDAIRNPYWGHRMLTCGKPQARWE